MYKIRVFSGFGPDNVCKEIFERLGEAKLCEFYGIDKKIYFTNEDDYTHVLLLNTPTPKIPDHIPKENVVGLAYEPYIKGTGWPYLDLTPEFIDYAKKNIGKYYVGEKYDLPEPFIESYSYMWHITPLKEIPVKKTTMSIMISNKYHITGHQYRHQLAQRILNDKIDVDIYGNGCKLYELPNHKNMKGKFDSIEPYEHYDFHIAIENCATPHYFSEKIINTLLCGTTPVYWGCKNIDQYFPDNVICLTGSIDEDIEIIKKILANPEKYKKNIDINKIKKRVSFIENVDSIF